MFKSNKHKSQDEPQKVVCKQRGVCKAACTVYRVPNLSSNVLSGPISNLLTKGWVNKEFRLLNCPICFSDRTLKCIDTTDRPTDPRLNGLEPCIVVGFLLCACPFRGAPAVTGDDDDNLIRKPPTTLT